MIDLSYNSVSKARYRRTVAFAQYNNPCPSFILFAETVLRSVCERIGILIHGGVDVKGKILVASQTFRRSATSTLAGFAGEVPESSCHGYRDRYCPSVCRSWYWFRAKP